ncbi:MAG: hypothetical protein M1833_003989 [Piccolia ochrophora]|nr:MAG: hypothetical protein M1833_003989 [Piccolia ochrophora]
MKMGWKSSLKVVSLGWLAVTVTALPESTGSINAADFASKLIITRDVCVIGGGSSGIYTAIRLRDESKSVVVVESSNRLGGHTETYTDPATQGNVDIGVIVWHDLDLVKDYFARFDIPLTKAAFPPLESKYIDYRTGKAVDGYTPSNATDALGVYGQQLAKYQYVEAGFDLPDPVPAELLLPFGDFVKKYALDGLVNLIFNYGQGLGDLLRIPTLYVFKNFGLDVLRNLQVGFLTTERHRNSELYERAGAELGADALLSTRVLWIDRNGPKYTKILVKTPSGIKLIRAKKLVITVPPKPENLRSFNLDQAELSLFKQFGNTGYYTGVLRNTGIPDNVAVNNVASDTPYNLPPLPGVYSLTPTGIPGLFNVKYGSTGTLPDAQVKADIVASVERLASAGSIPTATAPEFAIFKSHAPFELTVSADAIKNGFYRKLYALQGRKRTYWNGAAFHTHDSSLLWQFTEALLPRILE